MDALRLFRIVYHVAKKNNISIIPFPKQPFTTISNNEFIKDAEIFLLYPESFNTKNNVGKCNTESISLISTVNTVNLNNINIDINNSKKYFNI